MNLNKIVLLVLFSTSSILGQEISVTEVKVREDFKPSIPGASRLNENATFADTIKKDRSQEYKLYDIQGILINHVKSNDNESSNSLGGGGNMTTRHLRNFINAIRENEKLNSPIDDAVISQSLVHYANLAYRSDQSFMIDQNSGKIKNRKAKKYWSRDYEPSWEIKKI